MPRRRFFLSLIKIALVLIVTSVFLLMTVAPMLESMLPQNEGLSKTLEWTRSRVMESMIAVWFFAFGSMVGSFINVVVWRMPRGVSVVSNGSACPKCKQKIRLADNIPIFGWLKLGGRCRVCQLPISSRYPIVEAIFGSVFLLLFFVQLQTAGANLPGGSPYRTTGILQMIVNTKWDVVVTYAWHMLMFVMLMIWALMAYDRSRIPLKTVVFALLFGLSPPLFLDYLHPEKWIASHETWFTDLPILQNGITGTLGALAGFLVGSCVELLFNERRRIGLAVGMITIGAFLGWQALLGIVGVFGVCLLSLQMPTRSGQWPPMASLTLATLLHQVFWNQIHSLSNLYYWPSLLLSTLVIGVVLVFVVSRLQEIARPQPAKLEDIPEGYQPPSLGVDSAASNADGDDNESEMDDHDTPIQDLDDLNS